MSNLEFASSSPSTHNGYFLDLFVRCNNLVAIEMYEKMGYTVFRRVVGYYQGIGGGPDGEDAFGELSSLFPFSFSSLSLSFSLFQEVRKLLRS